VNVDAFLNELSSVFEGDPQTSDPVDPGWGALCEQVSGFTSPNELAVLQLAASLLPPEECYLEVGTFKGRSLCGAAQDNGDKRFYAVENYLEFGMLGQEARAELANNLRDHAQGVDVQLLEGDCFDVLAKPGIVDRPVGVYFYDGAHTGLAHYLALAVAEPLLADEALVLVDDASWPMVQKAHRRYLSRHDGWEVVQTWDAVMDDDPRWANGLHALRYRRPVPGPSTRSARTEAMRVFQTRLRGPATSLVWKTLHRYPRLVPAVKAVVPKKSRSVSGPN
jgi:predicted O-methyltransferase YrrM